MSFSPEWLALREPVDHRSISRPMQDRVAARFADADHVNVMDMGCGSGSNLRALSERLGQSQRWTLVDWDETLLVHARRSLAQWGETAEDDGDALVIHRDRKRIEILFERLDLARHVEHALDRPLDLLTAAAFFDLVSEDWMEGFAGALAVRGAPLYTTLTYNGRETWSPPHSADEAILQAFHAHQHSDKGFGPAAGPGAADALARALARNGFAVEREPSPWIMDRADARLMGELARGAAGAVRETGLVREDEVASWLEARLAASGCEIGHTDVFAIPR